MRLVDLVEIYPLLEDSPELTWIGPSPIGAGLCLGFEDGTIRLSGDKSHRFTPALPASPSQEAVNGVASTDRNNRIVSTRADVTLIQEKWNGVSRRLSYPGGSHGVVATPSGWFAAPLGLDGILLVNPAQDASLPMQVMSIVGRGLYFHRIAVLTKGDGREFLYSANRRGGVGVTQFVAGKLSDTVRTGVFDGLDVVDVCGLGDESHSAIAVSPKAELLWFQDVSSDAAPLAMKLSGIRGPVYRVLATARHLFILSSKAFYVWANLVDDLRVGRLSAPGLRSFELPMEAVDFSLFDECIHFVMSQNALARFRITDLEEHLASSASTGENAREARIDKTKGEVTRFLPTWVTHDVAQEMSVVS